MPILCYYAVHNGIMVVVSLAVCGWWIMRESVKMQRSLFRPVGKKDGAWLDLAEFEFAWWYINSYRSSTGPSSLDKQLLLLGKKLVLLHLNLRYLDGVLARIIYCELQRAWHSHFLDIGGNGITMGVKRAWFTRGAPEWHPRNFFDLLRGVNSSR